MSGVALSVQPKRRVAEFIFRLLRHLSRTWFGGLVWGGMFQAFGYPRFSLHHWKKRLRDEMSAHTYVCISYQAAGPDENDEGVGIVICGGCAAWKLTLPAESVPHFIGDRSEIKLVQ